MATTVTGYVIEWRDIPYGHNRTRYIETQDISQYLNISEANGMFKESVGFCRDAVIRFGCSGVPMRVTKETETETTVLYVHSNFVSHNATDHQWSQAIKDLLPVAKKTVIAP